MTALPEGVLVAWYGDDFTGSAATMEVLEFAGLPSVLFLDVPTPELVARFPDARAIGIASTARSQTPDWMDAHLPRAFDFLKQTQAPVLHYKTCSTLDSAPHVGSIGRAIDIGADCFASDWIPCLLAAPQMQRYQAFGNLFASAPGGIFRLDRHPVMSHHPVTPMDEADVALHLSRQTDRRFGLVNVAELDSDPVAALRREIDAGAEVISLDAMTLSQLSTVGALIWEQRGERIFAVGSQGVEYALVEHWRDTGALPRQDKTESAGAVDQMIAVSGSVSPVTAAQIDWAEANGFRTIQLDAAAVVRGDTSAETAALDAARNALSEGADPLIYSARGPGDPKVAEVRNAAGTDMAGANRRIGAALGRCLSALFRETGLKRGVISGGDTSGFASENLGLYAFTALAPTIPGAALLSAHSEDETLKGLQLALKGGQMGSPDYFGWIKSGGGPR